GSSASGWFVDPGERSEPVVNQAVDLEALTREAGAVLRRLLARNPDLAEARQGRHRLDLSDQRGELALQIGEGHQKVGTEGDEDITVIIAGDARGPGEQPESLDDQPEPEPLMAAERQQCPVARLFRI